ncbi:MAG TPA: hypothetical protein VKQ29_11960, partial [Aliidongia sp.]|nr:hypothetical protein [Aliidongia sp.]
PRRNRVPPANMHQNIAPPAPPRHTSYTRADGPRTRYPETRDELFRLVSVFAVSACPLAFPFYAYGISWRFDAIRNAPEMQVRKMVTDAFKDVPSTLARKS